MRFIRSFSVFGLCFLLANSAQALGLMQLYKEALVHDAKYQAARAVAEAGSEKSWQGLAGLLPSVNASGDTTWNEARRDTYFEKVDRTLRTKQKYNSHGWGAKLSQPLFDWQKISAYSIGKLESAQAEIKFASDSQDLMTRVAKAYFDVLYAEENLKAVQRNKSAISEQREQAIKNFEVGTATITDSQEAQARYDLMLAQEIAAISELEIKRHTLRTITGKPAGDLDGLKENASILPPQPAAIETWVDKAETANLTVMTQQTALEIAQNKVSQARAGHYPTINATANYSRPTPNTGVSASENNSFGIEISIPIFAGGGTSSRTREAVALRSASESALEDARRTATLNTQQAFLGVVNGLGQVRALEAALKSSELALSSNKLGYEVGVRINIDVLNAEQQVYTTRRDLAKARFEVLTQQLNLKAAVGELTEADLEEAAKLFEKR